MESRSYLDVNCAQATADADGDGMTNEMEYLVSTDPADSARVEGSRDLVNWSLLNTVEGNYGYLNAPAVHTVNLPLSNPKWFFRVSFQRP